MAEGNRSKKSLEQLKQEVAHSRDRLAREMGGLRYELNLPLKFRKSFQRSTGSWLAVAGVLGLLFTVAPRKKKVVVKTQLAPGEKKGFFEAGFVLTALRVIGTMLRPAITNYLASRMSANAQRR
jgi:hypothetical protein